MSNSGAHLPLQNEEIHLEEIQYKSIEASLKKEKNMKTYLREPCLIAKNEHEVRNNEEKIWKIRLALTKSEPHWVERLEQTSPPSYNCSYEQQDAVSPTKLANTKTLISSRLDALSRPVDHQAQATECHKTEPKREGSCRTPIQRKAMRFSDILDPELSCSEPAAFRKWTEDMLCISGDFPHSWNLRVIREVDSLCGSCDNDTLDNVRLQERIIFWRFQYGGPGSETPLRWLPISRLELCKRGRE